MERWTPSAQTIDLIADDEQRTRPVESVTETTAGSGSDTSKSTKRKDIGALLSEFADLRKGGGDHKSKKKKKKARKSDKKKAKKKKKKKNEK